MTKGLRWEELTEACEHCTKCPLYKTRKNVVVGKGSIKAPMMIIGEAPGEQEDEQGVPFVGRAGKLLNLIFDALSITEDDYYITNIVKCRPPGNRIPSEQEANMCLPYLRAQVRLIMPKIIVCLGATASKYIIDKNIRITKIRGEWREQKGFYIMPVFHPAALLRDPSKKALMWEDFKKIKEKLDDIKYQRKNSSKP
jgi:uracil-DNA glycosylase